MEECIPDNSERDDPYNEHLSALINEFVSKLDDEKRAVFVRRYWYGEPIADIAKKYGYTENRIWSMLHRTRKKLKKYIEGKDVKL